MKARTWLAAAIAAAWPCAAAADPVSAAATFSAFAASAAFVASRVLIAAAFFAFQSDRARRKQHQMQDAYNALLQDRKITLRGGIVPRKVTYGRDRIGGVVAFPHVTGSKGEFLHFVVALRGHECDAIETIYFNDIALPTEDVDGYVQSGEFCRTTTQSAGKGWTGTSTTLPQTPSRILAVTEFAGAAEGGDIYTEVSASHYTVVGNVVTVDHSNTFFVDYEYTITEPRVRIRRHLGGVGQVADADLIAAAPTKWTSAHRGDGVCYLYVRLQYDQQIFGQIGLPNISAVVRGKKVRDPRTGLTAWSDNTALCAADYLLDSVHGLGCSSSEVPDAEIIAAANICDELVSITAGGATQKRYTCNGSISTEVSPLDNLSILVDSMAGSAVWSQGRWLVRAGAYRTPTVTLTESDFADGEIQIVQRPSRSEAVNRIYGTFVDPSQSYAQVQYPDVTNATYLSQDGGLDLPREIPQPMCDGAVRAQRLAKIVLERARQGLTIRANFNWRAYDLLATDTVALTLARYGWVAKPFEVRERRYAPSGGLAYTLTETASGVYDWAYGEATTIDLAPNTTLPNPFTAPAALTGLAADSSTGQLQRLSDGSIMSRAYVTWTQSTDIFVVQGGRVELEWKLNDATDWQRAAPATGDATSAYISPLDDRRITLIRVRPVNSAGRTGPWTTITHTVVGKTAAPSNVASLSYTLEEFGVRLSWPKVADLDVDTYELRYGGSSWETATVIAQVNGSAYPWRVQGAGALTARIKALDTSGNYSATATTVSVSIAAPSAPSLSYQLAGPNETLSWSVPSASFALDHYEIRRGTASSTWATATFVDTTKGTSYTRRVDYAGDRRYFVAAVDGASNVGSAAQIDVSIIAPGLPTSARAETVDNNVLLYWAAPITGNLPVDRYEVRKGSTWAGGTVVGSNGNSTFAAIFEQQAGMFTYWVAAIDSAGNLGAQQSIAATVSQPPDYVLRFNLDSTFSGTKTNMYLESGVLKGPVNTSETWATHFSSRGWSSPADQIAAGFPLYANPSVTSGSYEEIIDYGAVLPSTIITATLNSTVVQGSVTVSCQIYYKLLLADPWTAGTAGATQIVTSNFRYVRVVWTFSCTAGANLIQCSAFNLKLAVKNRRDNGTFTISNATLGVAVAFNVPFISADTPLVQPGGTTALVPIVDYAGGANPTGFTVYLHNPATGLKVTGSGSWAVNGVY